MKVEDLSVILQSIQEDETYKLGVEWGRPRRGHPEGRIGDHIAELENNLSRISAQKNLTDEQVGKLRILIHVHDTLKCHATPKVPIEHPQSHASLAAEYLKNFIDDEDLIAMAQYHDEGYALYRQATSKGSYNKDRLKKVLATIKDLRLFLIFNIIDNGSGSKTPEPVIWLLQEIKQNLPSADIDDLIKDLAGDGQSR